MTKNKKVPVVFNKTSEQRTSLVERLVDAGYEVLQTKAGTQIGFKEETSGEPFTFRLDAKSIGAQGFAEILAQAKGGEAAFKRLVVLLETQDMKPDSGPGDLS